MVVGGWGSTVPLVPSTDKTGLARTTPMLSCTRTPESAMGTRYYPGEAVVIRPDHGAQRYLSKVCSTYRPSSSRFEDGCLVWSSRSIVRWVSTCTCSYVNYQAEGLCKTWADKASQGSLSSIQVPWFIYYHARLICMLIVDLDAGSAAMETGFLFPKKGRLGKACSKWANKTSTR